MDPTVVILTAIHVEYDAVKQFSERKFNLKWTEFTGLRSGRQYLRTVTPKGVTILLGRPFAMGPLEAVALAKDTIHDVSPSIILLCGILGGVHKDLKIGDVVLASSIFYDDFGKVTDDGVLKEPYTYKVDEELFKRLQEFRDAEWRDGIYERPSKAPGVAPNKCMVVDGVIASGNKVIASEQRKKSAN